MTVANAARVLSGPKVGSCRLQVMYIQRWNDNVVDNISRPVVVSFDEDQAREEVLQKAGMLKGSNVYITEDLSR